MAILAFDNFETTLAASLAESDYEMTIPTEAAAALWSAAGLSYDNQVWGSAAQWLLRVPMFIDDGTHVERIMLPLPAVEDGPTPIQRGSTRYAFAAGATVRCAPSAEHVAQGHYGVQDVAGSAGQALVVPGELVAVTSMGDSTFTLQFPEGAMSVPHLGETWPAEVLIALNTAGPVTVALKKYDLMSDAPVLMPGGSGLVASVDIPAGASFALFTIRRLPVGLPPYGIRGYYGWLVKMETWS